MKRGKLLGQMADAAKRRNQWPVKPRRASQRAPVARKSIPHGSMSHPGPKGSPGRSQRLSKGT